MQHSFPWAKAKGRVKCMVGNMGCRAGASPGEYIGIRRWTVLSEGAGHFKSHGVPSAEDAARAPGEGRDS